jgi:hypothetical protein
VPGPEGLAATNSLANTAIALRGKGKRRRPSRRRTSGTVSGMGDGVS